MRFPVTSPSLSPKVREWPWVFWAVAAIEAAWLVLLAWMAMARS